VLVAEARNIETVHPSTWGRATNDPRGGGQDSIAQTAVETNQAATESEDTTAEHVAVTDDDSHSNNDGDDTETVTKSEQA
jgi:hypothetical protein